MRRFVAAPLAILATALLLPLFAHAATDYLGGAATAAYVANDSTLPEDNINTIVGTAIAAVLGVLGVIFLVLMIYAGLLWMTAAGNSDNVKKAKGILLNSVIGLVIVLSSYAIAATVLRYLESSAY